MLNQLAILNRRGPWLWVVLAVALIVATAAYAFAASNTLPTTFAGEGSSVISGYTVTSVLYNLNPSNSSNIDSVTFTLNATAATVKISLVPGTFYSCTNVGNNWTCATTSPQATVLAAATLDIVATNP